MRELIHSLGGRCRQHLDSARGVLVVAHDAAEPCSACNGPMRVQKSVRRKVKTLVHGAVEVQETVHVCAARCHHPEGRLITQRARSLQGQLLPDSSVGYDVMVLVGTERFLRYRQREEIQSLLEEEHGISLSTGEISRLGHLFLEYLEALHVARSESLRAVLVQDGGWPLHVDATGEDGRGTLLVAYAGWRRWVLGSWKIPTERAEVLLPCLREVVARFGPPCAIMRDLGRAVIRACLDLKKELGLEIVILGCHFHFLRDVGSDLLKDGYEQLRGLFRKAAIQPDLRRLVRDLGGRLGEDIGEIREAVQAWLEDEAGHHLPPGPAALGAVRALAQWVLCPTSSTGRRFPFARPYLDLAQRCCKARRAVDAFLRKPPEDPQARRALHHLAEVLDPVSCEVPFQAVIQSLLARASLFDELRTALRIMPTASGGRPSPASARPLTLAEAASELQDIRTALDALVRSLRERRPQRGPAQDTRRAIDLVLDHVDRHGPTLWGHLVRLSSDGDGRARLVERTNDLLESFFRDEKHDERRRSGRKVLTQDFEHLPAAAALARNLERPDYVATLCGSLDRLPHAFAGLDAERRRQELAGKPADEPRRPHLEIASASLPTADRRVIRTDAMRERVEAAARSRAPRTASRQAS